MPFWIFTPGTRDRLCYSLSASGIFGAGGIVGPLPQLIRNWHDHINHELQSEGSAGVENNVLPAAGAGGKEGLVDLVHRGGHHRQQQSRSATTPIATGRREPSPGPLQRVADAVPISVSQGQKSQPAQNSIADEVAALAQDMVQFEDKLKVDSPEKKVTSSGTAAGRYFAMTRSRSIPARIMPSQTATGHQLRAIIPRLGFTNTDPSSHREAPGYSTR